MNKKRWSVSGMMFVLLGFVLLAFVTEARAIPAFARKYGTSCTTCHTAIPKRNAFGEAFRRNGYAMPEGDAALIKQEDVSLGADEWKDEFPETIWPGVIPPSFPLSAYVHQRMVVDFGEELTGNQIEFDMPHEFEVFLGMNLAKDISVFGEYIMFEKGSNVGPSTNGLKRFFFQFNDVVGKDNSMNIRVGLVEPGITDGYVDNNRIDLEHPLTLDYRASGGWRPRDSQAGVEINGTPHPRFYYAAGLLNGERKTVSDATDEKDVYARGAFKIGGMALDGSGEDLSEGLKIADNWRDDGVLVGGYVYHGNEIRSSGATSWDNDFQRFGFDVDAGYDRLNVRGGVIIGTDNNPYSPVDDDSVKLDSQALFVEGSYQIKPWILGMLRVGRASSKLGDNDWEEFLVLDPNLTVLVRPNVRLSLHLNFKDTKRSGGAEVEDERKWEWLKTNVMIVF